MYSIGIEEEFFVFDRRTRRAAKRADKTFIAAARAALGEHVMTEMLQSQIEVATPPCATMAEARDYLVRFRTTLGAAAKERGLGVASSPRSASGSGTWRGPHPRSRVPAGTPVRPGPHAAARLPHAGERHRRAPATRIGPLGQLRAPLRDWLYRLALERGYLDAILRDYVAAPFVRLFRRFDAIERRWTDYLAGERSREAEELKPHFGTIEELS